MAGTLGPLLFIALFSVSAFFLQPFGWSPSFGALLGLCLALAVIAVSRSFRACSAAQIGGATIGLVCGALLSLLITFVLFRLPLAEGTAGALSLFILLSCRYLGGKTGGEKFQGLFSARTVISSDHRSEESTTPGPPAILDTSVIIDGRIADIVETGFLEHRLAIPQFVLRELQLVADSADSLKRNRGRRGLDVLSRLQKVPGLDVQIIDQDFPQIREVDMKLVELGKLLHARLVTNDFNLNKVAQLQGVEVLNINELANALKPVVLPGEVMRVFVLKEGKEANQGVAYLDDGTMVVVDNARRHISKTLDISVTSVLQTTAGKMIFGRFDERLHTIHDKADRPPQRETSAAGS